MFNKTSCLFLSCLILSWCFCPTVSAKTRPDIRRSEVIRLATDNLQKAVAIEQMKQAYEDCLIRELNATQAVCSRAERLLAVLEEETVGPGEKSEHRRAINNLKTRIKKSKTAQAEITDELLKTHRITLKHPIAPSIFYDLVLMLIVKETKIDPEVRLSLLLENKILTATLKRLQKYSFKCDQ